MDPFANGLHCIYDHIQHRFVPSDQNMAHEQIQYQNPSIDVQRIRSNEPRPLLQPSLDASDPTAEVKTSPQEHIRRPRNAFMIFRTEFLAGNKINRNVEHDNRHISRIAGHYWNSMTEEEKSDWQLKADQEKMAHMRKYPMYKFSPSPRRKKSVRRKVGRNGVDELLRCRRVADLLLEGKEGEELVNAVRDSNIMAPRTPKKGEEDEHCQLPSSYISEEPRVPKGPSNIFRDPLSLPEKVDEKLLGASSVNHRVIPPPTTNGCSLSQPSFSSSPMSPLPSEYFNPYEVMGQPNFTIPPLPRAMSPVYYPEQSGLLPNSTTYNTYLQSPDHPYSPIFTEPLVNFHLPAEEHHISFDFLSSVQSIKFDAPYRAPDEFSPRHRPSRSTRNPSFHPYSNLPSHLSAPLPLQSPDVDAQFLGHNLRR